MCLTQSNWHQTKAFSPIETFHKEPAVPLPPTDAKRAMLPINYPLRRGSGGRARPPVGVWGKAPKKSQRQTMSSALHPIENFSISRLLLLLASV